jgi:serine/threonine protein kinase
MYAFSLDANDTQQYLVYAGSANGSLDGFLRDDVNRARLSATTRLTIMFEIVRVVSFLHSGGGKQGIMFHRDIQCATIWLSEDFSAKLMDCGLYKLVPNIQKASTKTSSSSSTEKGSSSPFGTRGHMCPEYLNHPDSDYYEDFYDAYSMGIVMVELILGRLIGDCACDSSSSKLGSEFLDVLRDVIESEEGSQVINACEWLKDHADRSIVWREDYLDVLCTSAMECLLAFTPIGRKAAKEAGKAAAKEAAKAELTDNKVSDILRMNVLITFHNNAQPEDEGTD